MNSNNSQYYANVLANKGKAFVAKASSSPRKEKEENPEPELLISPPEPKVELNVTQLGKSPLEHFKLNLKTDADLKLNLHLGDGDESSSKKLSSISSKLEDYSPKSKSPRRTRSRPKILINTARKTLVKRSPSNQRIMGLKSKEQLNQFKKIDDPFFHVFLSSPKLNSKKKHLRQMSKLNLQQSFKKLMKELPPVVYNAHGFHI